MQPLHPEFPMTASEDAVKSAFLAALEKGPAERGPFLDSACQGDPGLRRRVEALLAVHDAADPLLDRPAAWHLDLPSMTPVGKPPTPVARPSDHPEPTHAGRFRLLEEIARGGMGAVLWAFDPELDRNLAVKVVLPQHRDDPAMNRRFLGEARLTGQLQHPGVVPVYDVGRLADDRPYFAMKLIEGQTLADLLRDRPNPAHDLPRFLRYFEAVCQATGYAHSRGVIHRDLKPSNVMVDAFGEVQVMDWGLAKLLPSRPPSGETPASGESAQAARREVDLQMEAGVAPDTGNDSRTQPGRVLGTP